MIFDEDTEMRVKNSKNKNSKFEDLVSFAKESGENKLKG